MKQLLLFSILFFTIISYSQTIRCSVNYDSTLVIDEGLITAIPEFHGGEASLSAYIKKHISPYTLGLEESYVTFIIDTLGQVKNVCIRSNIIRQKLSNNEQTIIEACENMPNWIIEKNEYTNRKYPSRFMIKL